MKDKDVILRVILCLLAFILPLAAQSHMAKTVVIVYNTDQPGAEDLAKYYASKRGIPPKNIIRIKCTTEEMIGRNDFDSAIKWPVRMEMSKRGLYKFRMGQMLPPSEENLIRYIVLIRGVPLRISHVDMIEKRAPDVLTVGQGQGPLPDGYLRNEAAVDSELAMLPHMEYPLAGPLPNPYFGSNFKFFDSSAMFIVARLDASSDEEVRRMIDDAIETEKTGLKGKVYIDARGLTSGPLELGDRWMRATAGMFDQAGFPVIFDDRDAMFASEMAMPDAAVYAGWYAENITGPMAQPQFRFVRGGIAYHLHSFSATTIRTPGSRWVGPFITHGASASMGCVYEPYLYFTPDLSIFFARLLKGNNFGESAYASIRALSWHVTVVGDPLYVPFPAGRGE